MKKIKTLSTIILCVIFISCGFKPVNQKGYGQIHINNINIIGEPRIANALKNKFLTISNINSEKKYDVEVELKKNKKIKIKDRTGKVTRYTLNIESILRLTDLSNNDKIEKNFSSNQDFEVGEIHSDTINNESNARKNVTQLLSDDIANFISITIRKR